MNLAHHSSHMIRTTIYKIKVLWKHLFAFLLGLILPLKIKISLLSRDQFAPWYKRFLVDSPLVHIFLIIGIAKKILFLFHGTNVCSISTTIMYFCLVKIRVSFINLGLDEVAGNCVSTRSHIFQQFHFFRIETPVRAQRRVEWTR